MWYSLVNSDSFDELKLRYVSNRIAGFFISTAFVLTLYPLCVSYAFNIFRDYGVEIPNVPYIAAVLISIVARRSLAMFAILIFLLDQFGILGAFFGA